MQRKIISFIIFGALIAFSVFAYADSLHDIRINFLKGNYNDCINDGERELVDAYHSKNADELYYMLAVSYIKTGNLMRAEDIFEILIKEFKNSKYRDDAYLGLGDVSLMEQDYAGAELKYKELLKVNPYTRLIALVELKLAQSLIKQGKWDEAKVYLNKLNSNYPSSLEQKLAQSLWSDESYFTLQVGSFSADSNAQTLKNKLIAKGYPAYIEEAKTQGNTTYRVRVGKLKTRPEAEVLEKELAALGYPARIFP